MKIFFGGEEITGLKEFNLEFKVVNKETPLVNILPKPKKVIKKLN